MSDFLYRLGFGLTGRNLIALLRREQPAGPAAGGTAAPAPGAPEGGTDGSFARLPRHAETSVVVSIGDSLAARDRRHARTLLRKQKALASAAHARFDAMRRLSTARAHPRWRNEATTEATAEDRAALPPASSHGTGTFREMFDPHRPLIAERTLLVIEAVFVVVELAFWYGVLSGNVQAHAATFDLTRISDILLAVLIPLSGIVAARIIGGLTHRVMRRYPGTGRGELIGAGVSAAVAGLAIFAIFKLVDARFAAAGTGLSALVFQPPALAMTLVFIVVLVGDMIARIFLVSEIRAQTEKWHRQVDRLAKRATRANRKHVKAWLELRNAVQRYLDTCERVVSAGARIISDERSRAGTAAAPSLPAATAQIRRAHEPGGEHTTAGPMAVPSVAQLQLFGVTLAPGPLRVAQDAVDTLRRWPPFHHEDLASQVGGMAERLHRLPPAPNDETSSEAPAAPSSEPAARGQGQVPRPRFQPTEPLQPGKPGEPPAERNGDDPEAEHSDAGESEGP
jgi:hypothetical protein